MVVLPRQASLRRLKSGSGINGIGVWREEEPLPACLLFHGRRLAS